MQLGRRLSMLATKLALALAGVYTASMLVLATWWAVAPERTWWIALSNLIAPNLFVPLVALVPLALLLRSRVLGLMAAVLLLLFVALFAPRLLPHVASNAAQTHQRGLLRVVTFNQKFNNADIAGSLEVLHRQQGDIIAFQELSTPMVQGIEGDAELVARFPYRWFEPAERASGMGIMSRLPFTAVPASKDLLMQAVEIEVAGQQITFLNAHPIAPTLDIGRLNRVKWLRGIPMLERLPWVLSYNPRRRNEHLEALIADIDGRNGSLIVAGDFNTADRDPLYTQLAARMRDTFAETNWGFGNTFPNAALRGRVSVPFPLVRIDYVWTRGDITPVRANVVCDARGSDHCMLVADVAIGGT